MSKGHQRKPTPQTKTRGDIIARVERWDIVDEYGSRIREARERLGLTREELASRIQEKASYVKKIENGEAKPSVSLARKIERVLKIKLLEEVSQYEGQQDVGTGGGKRDLTLADLVDLEGIYGEGEKRYKR
ncbi:MAG: multiprotein-bridging factor 1 family protein [Aigarchaeota archaeon]|nr:multiprotein-bridging factor 1 family protein [Aigarchaeota archaeon]MDW8092672.1 multiprotein-bridging factor 1 family protein [Nitrososphaerota archaeon]